MNMMPSLGMGTFRLEGDDAYNAVSMALETGFRHIDTAQIYGNEAEVGQAIADSGIARNELFLTTKVWLENLGEDAFIPSVEESLRKLQVEAVDLLLIHWPEVSGKVAMDTYLPQLAEAQRRGLTRFIGVSNFTNAQLDQAIEILGEGSILTNQVEVHPYLQNRRVIEHCQSRNIQVTGYMPLAVGKVMKDDVLQRIAERHEVSVAEVVLAWQLQQGLVTIPSSTKRVNLETNLNALRLELNDDDMADIASLEQGERIANPDFAPQWD
ncbi:2,5-didehydrogluconate reductase DkgB [Oceanimonas sp. NS1]|uniref:2,5-didehydrogluconate reductase B n=1 Tax=Oceanimonas doudoroffii TaxID=84158 RepID=A0A233RIF7_9GAMM|nr:2,5-didehydrogluconate reductase DkgB [Oceanimonas doudoroffii]MCT7655329.1 2,5-didehydrogluconate reductase DkgB [Oceanimonas sp. NS1]OXY83162.1 2,5-didehydrogluconate reductase B [Oceanimonas doudoroffii]